MSLLVDYSCRTCSGRFETWVNSPPPARARCSACGGTAHRSWSPVGLVGLGATPVERSAAPKPAVAPCASNRDVPGLCCLTPEAGRMWLARARGDNRSIDRELARQETRVAQGHAPPPLTHSDSSHVRKPAMQGGTS